MGEMYWTWLVADDDLADAITPEGFEVLWTRSEHEVEATETMFGSHSSGSSVAIGQIFYFDSTEFADFDFSTPCRKVEQWRNGKMIWAGNVVLGPGTGSIAGLDSAPRGSRCNAFGLRYPPS